MHISPGSLASMLFYFLLTVNITSMPFQWIIHKFSTGLCPYLDLLNLWHFKIKLPSCYSQSCFAILFPRAYPSYLVLISVELLILNFFFPFSLSSWLEFHLRLRHQSLWFLPHSLVDSVSIPYDPCFAITQETQTWCSSFSQKTIVTPSLRLPSIHYTKAHLFCSQEC